MADVELPDPAELEERKAKSFTRRVALTTAVYAVVLAITSLGGNNATKDMMLDQQQAADKWAYYQAKNIRGHQTRLQRQWLELDLAQRGPEMQEEARKRFEALIQKWEKEENRYETEKEDIKKEAEKLENERDVSRARDPFFDYAEVLLQISIVLASIAILSSSRPVFIISVVLASLGGLLCLNGYTLWVKIPFLSS